ICREKPDTNLILLDDAFQHRAIHAGFNLLLTSFDDPYYADFIVPVGNLREFKAGKKRAQAVIVTKCPDFSQINQNEIRKKLNLNSRQDLFFSRLKYGVIRSMNDASVIESLQGFQVILVTGIANANPLVKKISDECEVLHHFSYADHHRFKPAEINEIHSLFDKFAGPQTIVLTTEKDAMRLMSDSLKSMIKNFPWYFQEIEVEIDDAEKFDKMILNYAEKNS
ncbi:MAG: tetraacyldisaccharide 4'-kinase, partial [Crocinitomicaceae bacterium]|nr:tetraacyldisaccharide 4'-kinase [Crocinitomicaceae bacterium]